jgi:hypothetical protein
MFITIMDVSYTLENIKVVSRKACLADFIDSSESNQVDGNKNDYIQKNQKDYGHKKRIKP